eukprot:11467212-Alexandrium_andersonii.AAC.1
MSFAWAAAEESHPSFVARDSYVGSWPRRRRFGQPLPLKSARACILFGAARGQQCSSKTGVGVA